MKKILFFCFVLSATAIGRIRHVPQDYSTIQAAINISFEDDTVLVATGTYRENIDFNGINITLGSQYIITGDTSYISSTILDGRSAGQVVIFHHDEHQNARLKGFTIKNGWADNGGGIVCINSSPTISNNTIRSNNATGFGKGGGILCDSSASPIISNNRFLQNHAYYGAAIGCINSSHPMVDANSILGHSVDSHGGAVYCINSNPTIINNIFTNNSAGWGGAITCYTNSPARISHNYFINNAALWGGAIYCLSSSAIIDSNTIISNHADYDGGGINGVYNSLIIRGDSLINNTSGAYGGGINASGVEIISNCYISGNSAERGGGVASGSGRITGNNIRNNSATSYGGGVVSGGRYSQVDNNIFSGNTTNGYGGGITCSGSPVLRNIFIGNSAAYGGGLASKYDSQTVANNIFMGNSSVHGGALACMEGADVNVTSSILWGDTLQGRAEIFVSDSATVTVNYCDITGGFQGTGNIDVEPLLRNPAAGDFRLMSTACGDSFNSPCIDTGDRNFIDTLLSCQWGLGSRLCDMGIYGGREPSGHTINVPGNYSHIQAAIEASHNKDTILVHPGTYRERLDFHSKNIVVGSMYIITGDTSYINSTIINGDSTAGTLVTISGFQDTTTVLAGFTIKNGHSTNGGGGIKSYNSNPQIHHNIIKYNLSSFGGGMYCEYGGHGVISNNLIINNHIYDSRGLGAGIMCDGGTPKFENNIIVHNTAYGVNSRGGGVGMYATGATFINNTISANWADSGGGVYIFQGSPVFTNTIVWGNSATEGAGIVIDAMSHPAITYCDIEGGRTGIGNIELDPLFRDSTLGDWRLMSMQCGYSLDSPCIDSGDPSRGDSILSCAWGLETEHSDMGAFGGGSLLQSAIEDERPRIPEQIILQQNYPNPFNAQTTISFTLPRASHATVNIYDLLGRQVARLLDENRQAGYHQVTWNAGNLSSGIYFYRIEAGDFSKTRKMLLLK